MLTRLEIGNFRFAFGRLFIQNAILMGDTCRVPQGNWQFYEEDDEKTVPTLAEGLKKRHAQLSRR